MNRTLLALLLLAMIPAVSADAAESAGKPNIILIYSDDHGFADLGVQGVDSDIRTPNIDALARDGIRFKRGYVSAPQCVPSRAGVITGRYQQRFGVEDNTLGPLPLAEVTIAERLKPAGYTSAQVGKWHLEPNKKSAREDAAPEASDRAFLPGGQGFDEYFCGPMNNFVASHDLKGNKLPNPPRPMSDKRFRCIWQTDAAISFIERHHADPFFLYLAYYTPHVPLESPEPWFSKTPTNLPKERRQALSMIAAMDDGIGKVRETLRKQGIDRKTLIFFIGDNGAPLREGAWNGSLNLPLVGEKGMLTDGGIRTPFVAAWPGTLPAGKVYEPPVINFDVAATANALAGLPPDEKLDGVNLMPFLTGEKAGNPHDALFWRWRSQAAVRADHWKLILLGDQRFLFDLDSQEGEHKNCLSDFPEVAKDMEKKLMAWNATLPPPGLPRKVVQQDQNFFDTHVTGNGTEVKTPGAGRKTKNADEIVGEAGKVQGWIGRSCKLQLKDGALQVIADAKSKSPFIACTGMKVAGPATATLRVLCPEGGNGSIAWRTDVEKDFAPGQETPFKLAPSTDWQTVTVTVPAKGTIIHLRLRLPGKVTTSIAAIDLRPDGGKAGADWKFDK